MRTYDQRFDVNCSILFTELPLLKRPAAARSAGFDAVEFWWPFAEPVPPDRKVDRFLGALDDAGVRAGSAANTSHLIWPIAPRASAGDDCSCC